MSQVNVMIEQLPRRPQQATCTKNCEPVFDSMGLTCGCKDAYVSPVCTYAGITGWYGKNYCIKFDQDYGGCLPCIGCKKDCDAVTACSFN